MNRDEIIKIIKDKPSVKAYGIITGNEEWAEGLDRLIPQHMQNSVVLWVCMGILPGGFFKAVLENDLFGACRMADEINLRNLPNYHLFFVNYAPCQCFGSSENVEDWEREGGLGSRDQ